MRIDFPKDKMFKELHALLGFEILSQPVTGGLAAMSRAFITCSHFG